MTNLQDEAYQTELMYENALFIEEIAKNVSERLQKHVNERHIKNYLVQLSQKESINTYETLVKIEYGEK
jgi:GTP cyclohydrolase FolE2